VARIDDMRAAKRLNEAFPGDADRAKGVGKETGEGREHRRVSEWLGELAEEWDYPTPVGKPSRQAPAALFRTRSAPFDVFFASAKDQERPTHKKSADEIRGYFETLLDLQEEGEVSEILFGIGSSDDAVADAWSDFLVELADEKGIEVEAQRHPSSDGDEDDDDPLILVFIEIKTPSDDDEEDQDDDEDEEYAVN
jgi:hypothetical protein